MRRLLLFLCLFAAGSTIFEALETQRRVIRLRGHRVVQQQGSFTDDPTALWASASGGVGTGTCVPPDAACTLTRALSVVADNGIIILNSGTYSTAVTLTGTNHDGVTVTTTAAVKNALGTFTRGIPAGTDNRPLLQNVLATLGRPGTTIEYLRIQHDTAPHDDGDYAYCVTAAVGADHATLRASATHIECFNGGQGGGVKTGRNVTFSHWYVHDMGTSGPEDKHGFEVQSGTGAVEGASFDTAVIIEDYTCETIFGDCVQENTAAYGGAGEDDLEFSYLWIRNGEAFDISEQCGDFKGTRFLRWSGNECYDAAEGGISGTHDPSVVARNDWDIWNNIFRDLPVASIFPANLNLSCARWRIWNNVFIRTVTNLPGGSNTASVELCGDSGSYFVHNTGIDNTNGNTSPRSWFVYNHGSDGGGNTGNNIRNNICYRTGTGTDDRRCWSAIGSEDAGTPNTNYCRPTDASTDCSNGGLGQAGTNQISTLFAAGNGPGFTDISTDNLHLQSGSPNIDVGLALGSHASLTAADNFTIGIDADGNNRDSSTPNLGAFETIVNPAPAPALQAVWLRLIGEFERRVLQIAPSVRQHATLRRASKRRAVVLPRHDVIEHRGEVIKEHVGPAHQEAVHLREDVVRGGIDVRIAVNDQPVLRREGLEESRQRVLEPALHEADARIVAERRLAVVVEMPGLERLGPKRPLLWQADERVEADEAVLGMGGVRGPITDRRALVHAELQVGERLPGELLDLRKQFLAAGVVRDSGCAVGAQFRQAHQAVETFRVGRVRQQLFEVAGETACERGFVEPIGVVLRVHSQPLFRL